VNVEHPVKFISRKETPAPNQSMAPNPGRSPWTTVSL
jgi:hypothetical protein